MPICGKPFTESPLSSSHSNRRSHGCHATVTLLPSITHNTVPSASTSAVNHTGRQYHRGLSKLMMNDSRYKLSGSTHRNGITAMSWQILFVTASNSTEPHAGSANQSQR